MINFYECKYQELLTILNPNIFYSMIRTEEDFCAFFQAITQKYAQSGRIKTSARKDPALIKLTDKAASMGWVQGDDGNSIYLSKKLYTNLECVKNTKDLSESFPYLIFEVVIHEFNHILQTRIRLNETCPLGNGCVSSDKEVLVKNLTKIFEAKIKLGKKSKICSILLMKEATQESYLGRFCEIEARENSYIEGEYALSFAQCENFYQKTLKYNVELDVEFLESSSDLILEKMFEVANIDFMVPNEKVLKQSYFYETKAILKRNVNSEDCDIDSCMALKMANLDAMKISSLEEMCNAEIILDSKTMGFKQAEKRFVKSLFKKLWTLLDNMKNVNNSSYNEVINKVLINFQASVVDRNNGFEK